MEPPTSPVSRRTYASSGKTGRQKIPSPTYEVEAARSAARDQSHEYISEWSLLCNCKDNVLSGSPLSRFRREGDSKSDTKIYQKSVLFLRLLLEGFGAQKGAQRTPNGDHFGALLASFLRSGEFHEKCDSIIKIFFACPGRSNRGLKSMKKT